MTWVYSELTKEAGKRGGPYALRYFHRGQGVVIGAALAGAALAGILFHDKWRARRAAAPTYESTTAAPAPDDAPAIEHS
ncbi:MULTISPECIES: hypothetical protein [Streptomyces]|uniref:HIG1 domain-containing protein n=1 Tax=Streptomyces flaveolus TaxID=67297 RepID=A0ABV3AN43_9ACTN|nr:MULTISPECIES: hypothetical protein [Streptomyces]KMS87951.1 hypothetical protein ACZ91_27800 [Streptomyces regensis]